MSAEDAPTTLTNEPVSIVTTDTSPHPAPTEAADPSLDIGAPAPEATANPTEAAPLQESTPARSPFEPVLPSRSAPRVIVRRTTGAGTFSPSQSAPFGERGGQAVQEFELRDPETAFEVGYREPGRRRPVVRRRTVDVAVAVVASGEAARAVPSSQAVVVEEPETMPAETDSIPASRESTSVAPGTPPTAALSEEATAKAESVPNSDNRPASVAQEEGLAQEVPEVKGMGGEGQDEEAVTAGEVKEGTVANTEVEVAAESGVKEATQERAKEQEEKSL